jgi:hypothetical protein
MDYIDLDDCEERKLYRLDARNIKIGVFSLKWGFIGIRTKWGSRFLDSENHWDAPQYATAKPLEVIGELPEHIECESTENKELFDWLEQQENNLVS